MAALVGLDYYLRARIKSKNNNTLSVKVKALAREERLRLEIDRVLLQAGIEPAGIEVADSFRRIRVPAGINLETLYQYLIAAVLQAGGEVAPSRNLPRGEKGFSVALAGRAVDTIRLVPAPPVSGKIAIVIDDFGYSDDAVVEQFLNLPFTITYAIIPGLPHSTTIAQRLRRANRAAIVHMPMEALEKKVEQNGYELLVASSPEEIRSRVRKALAAVPGARGVNNHMGSRATQDEALLNTLFAELKKSGMFFLDSRTTPETRAFRLAIKQGLASGLNDGFLDTVAEADYIRQKLSYLARTANESGAAIGIGHPHRATLQVLQEVVPQLQRRGFEMVAAEQVIRRQPQQFSTVVH